MRFLRWFRDARHRFGLWLVAPYPEAEADRIEEREEPGNVVLFRRRTEKKQDDLGPRSAA